MTPEEVDAFRQRLEAGEKFHISQGLGPEHKWREFSCPKPGEYQITYVSVDARRGDRQESRETYNRDGLLEALKHTSPHELKSE